MESAIESAALKFGDLTSIAPPLISSASCECVGEVAPRTMPPSISVSDMIARVGLISLWEFSATLGSRIIFGGHGSTR